MGEFTEWGIRLGLGGGGLIAFIGWMLELKRSARDKREQRKIDEKREDKWRELERERLSIQRERLDVDRDVATSLKEVAVRLSILQGGR